MLKVTSANSIRLRPRLTGYHGWDKVTEEGKIERPVGRTLPAFGVVNKRGNLRFSTNGYMAFFAFFLAIGLG
jgi:hypothetical protein